MRLPQGGENYVRYVGELMTLKQEIFSNIVSGELGVDEGLAQYEASAERLNLSEILAELNS